VYATVPGADVPAALAALEAGDDALLKQAQRRLHAV
jgi:hypothetical protein